jgi:hypothetical protein
MQEICITYFPSPGARIRTLGRGRNGRRSAVRQV